MALLAGQLGTLLAGKKADMVCMVKESTIVLTAPPRLSARLDQERPTAMSATMSSQIAATRRSQSN